MDARDLMDVIATHATAAAAVVDTKFVDVAVAFPAARGRCVRIFYGGEAGPEHFPDDRTLNSKLVGERIFVRGYWPVAEYGRAKRRSLMGEMWQFKHELRTRVLGDSQLGGDSVDLNMHPATTDDITLAGIHYALLEIEFVVDFGEYALAP